MDTPARSPGDAIPGPGNTLGSRVGSPLSIAAYVTWLAIIADVIDFPALLAGDPRQLAGAVALAGMLALFVVRAWRDPAADCRDQAWNTLLQGALVVGAEALLLQGQVSVLLIIVAAQLVLLLPVVQAVAWLVLFNAAFVAIWLSNGASLLDAVLWSVPVMGFQAFAGLIGHYAGMSDRQREHLAAVNAELLATRELLEESARSGERLKLSRELHDVAGHKLTALKLNLARLARDPALAGREEVAVSRELADELLADIRAVVSELRAHDGLDLRAALEALARPIPGTRIEVAIDPGLRVDGMAQAEALLRCAQEAITNAVRHGRAGTVVLRVRRDGEAIELLVENDGDRPADLRPGNGLTGMRERLEGLGGSLALEPLAPRGLRLRAWLPAGVA